MKVLIESSSPDGLTVKFESKFYFDTWSEAIDFIRSVDNLRAKPPTNEECLVTYHESQNIDTTEAENG